MREIVAVCRSTKRSRDRVAAVLDRYLWRIGDRTWRGRASNACLDRMARELRREAKRNTAVTIHEIRSARESRVPIIRIGARRAFSPDGLVPVSTHAGRSPRWPPRPERDRHLLALVRIAALFHDLGKATRLFQNKLWRALRGGAPEADPIRHELHSAVVWDILTNGLDDEALIARLAGLAPSDIDAACRKAAAPQGPLHGMHAEPGAPVTSVAPGDPVRLSFADREGSIAHAVGMLVLTHHRLPEGSSNHRTLLPTEHVHAGRLATEDLAVAPGRPFWHDERWLSALRRASDDLRPAHGAPGLDMALRVSLMFADHLASALREPRDPASVKPETGHLANTGDGRPADALDRHILKVLQRVPGCFDMLHRHRERYPALDAMQVPMGLLHPEPAPAPFAWQEATARAARALCSSAEGGFFACIVAGTGTGKTRGAPTLLAAAAFADTRPERRYLRMTLALGLRSLAGQAADDYVHDLRFPPTDVAVLIGQPPLRFDEEPSRQDKAPVPQDGAESAAALPEWLQVERAGGGPPPDGTDDADDAGADTGEEDWLRGLSHDPDRALPATLDLILEKAGSHAVAARRLVATPVVVGTIDHLMGVATPTSARYLFQAVRAITADLILDEIDQYDPEDIAAIGRLVHQTAAAGRRVIAMSATPRDVAVALAAAYRAGWRAHAAAAGVADHVNALCAGDADGACVVGCAEEFGRLYEECRGRVLEALEAAPPRRRGRILPPCDGWDQLVGQIDTAATGLHDALADHHRSGPGAFIAEVKRAMSVQLRGVG